MRIIESCGQCRWMKEELIADKLIITCERTDKNVFIDAIPDFCPLPKEENWKQKYFDMEEMARELNADMYFLKELIKDIYHGHHNLTDDIIKRIEEIIDEQNH